MNLNFWFNILSQVAVDDPHKFNNFLILGYVVMWLVAVVYVAYLANKQRNAKKDLELMKQLLAENEEESPR
jgi:CcmD family protein